MAMLLAVEWVGLMIVAAAAGSGQRPLLTAILCGPVIVLPVIGLTSWLPGRALSRHAVAVAQMLISAALIRITGGRIESNFHVFGSLTFLAFYADWTVLLTASAVTLADQGFALGWIPAVLSGATPVNQGLWLEHAAWVLFEDLFLVLLCRQSLYDTRQVSSREARLAWERDHDHLTGLATARLLHQKCMQPAGRDGSRRGALVFIDLDGFRQVNEMLGHPIGDRLLAVAALRLSRAIADSDVLARLGGDEFAAIVEGVETEDDATKLGERLLRALDSEPMQLDSHRLAVTAGIGIALYPAHGNNLNDLARAADLARHKAKAKGRRRCEIFSAAMRAEAQRAEQLEKDLHQALARGEIKAHYQPQVGLDQRVAGFEALMRWEHGSLGMIPPDEFIPVAEKTGLIAPLGEWILRDACAQCRRWAREGFGRLPVAVNVSPIQFERADFPTTVRRILSESGLDPSLLTLELTETVLVRNVELARRHLTELRRSGLRIALDDFGTGYSSLSQLMDLPADIVKLDRSLVRRELDKSRTILASVIGMAHGIGMRVVAEGVESRRQNEMLRSLECDEVQGFYYSPALPPARVAEFLERHTPEVELLELAV